MSDARSLLLAIAVIVVATRLGGLAAERIRQPRVMGEILAGLILGPSLLGRLAPDVFAFLFPAPAVSALQP
jgi:Kef-type K+ transport system membrane component KefB